MQQMRNCKRNDSRQLARRWLPSKMAKTINRHSSNCQLLQPIVANNQQTAIDNEQHLTVDTLEAARRSPCMSVWQERHRKRRKEIMKMKWRRYIIHMYVCICVVASIECQWSVSSQRKCHQGNMKMFSRLNLWAAAVSTGCFGVFNKKSGLKLSKANAIYMFMH